VTYYYGYSLFGCAVNTNVLLNFGLAQPTGTVVAAYIGMIVKLAYSFALCVFPARDSLYVLLSLHSSSVSDAATDAAAHTLGNDISDATRILSTVSISAAMLLLAIYVPSVAILFAVVGAFLGGLVSFVLPGTLYLRVTYCLAAQGKQTAPPQWRRCVAWTMIIGGSLLSVLGTYHALLASLRDQPSA
jgi:amino acid permease